MGLAEHLKFLVSPEVRAAINQWNPRLVSQVVAEQILSSPWAAQYRDLYGEEPDLNPYSAGYDYQKAWESGVRPQLYLDNLYHWASANPAGEMLKSPSHPTAWMEYFMRKFGTDPNAISAWGEDF